VSGQGAEASSRADHLFSRLADSREDAPTEPSSRTLVSFGGSGDPPAMIGPSLLQNVPYDHSELHKFGIVGRLAKIPIGAERLNLLAIPRRVR